MMKPFVLVTACFCSLLTPGVVGRGGSSPQQLRRLVTTTHDEGTGLALFNDEIGTELPDNFPTFVGPDDTNVPKGDGSLPSGGFDWGNIDWGKSTFQDFNWGSMDWSNEDWQSFLDSLNGMLDFCPILESAMGISQAFAVAAKCSCDGTLMEGLSVQCQFESCPESLACGEAGLNFTTEGRTGLINTSVCVDLTTDQFEEVCFSYQMDRIGEGSTNEQTCFASYGGNPCGCNIQDFCLTVDCSAFLPGAVMDTCQRLSFDRSEDIQNLFPRFPVFDESFDGTFAFENINWTNLDWQNLDWTNFNFDHVDWRNADGDATQWGSLFGDTPSLDICSILSAQIVGVADGVYQNSCACEGDSETGFKIQCSFNDQCMPASDTDPAAIASSGTTPSPGTVCGNLTMSYTFDIIGSIGGSLCVDFDEGIHPKTCIEYSIPFAAQDITPTCKATYGGKDCKCSIEETLCVKVDCSEHETTAVTTNCQNFEFTSSEDVPQLMPRFGVPAASSGDASGSVIEVRPESEEEPDGVEDGNTAMDILQPNTENLEGEESPSSSMQTSRDQLGVFTLVGSILFLLA